ncbi:DUF397 domain-containing protein [Streptomyces sp. NPDC049881]|uniref:DUF397 domain-containing protein n=1 Tax=Streptomyces sp. NPDC049881 TaxID=3155778 RepID=UPI00343839DE
MRADLPHPPHCPVRPSFSCGGRAAGLPAIRSHLRCQPAALPPTSGNHPRTPRRPRTPTCRSPHDGGSGLPVSNWAKSSDSASSSGGCIEWSPSAAALGTVPVRDPKAPEGPTLTVTGGAWRSFVGAVRKGALAN